MPIGDATQLVLREHSKLRSDSRSVQSVSRVRTNGLVIVRMPLLIQYRPGEQISYEGLLVTCDGTDVTEQLSFDVEEGSVWHASQKVLPVTACYVDSLGTTHQVSFELKQKRSLLPIALSALALLAVTGVVTAGWWLAQPKGDSGIRIRQQGDEADAEVRTPSGGVSDSARMTIAVNPIQELSDDGRLQVNFSVVEPNGGLSERFEIVQNDAVVYRSSVVSPGETLEWVDAPQVVSGAAKITVHAVSADGGDVGSPVSVEVTIVSEAANGR